MNSLRALSSTARRFCISLKVIASWPTSSAESTGIGFEKSPSATFSAAASSRRRRRAMRARDQPARRQRREQRDPPGDQDLAADQRDVVLDVGEIRTNTAIQRAVSPSERTTAVSPSRTPPSRSTALAIGPAAIAAEAAG